MMKKKYLLSLPAFNQGDNILGVICEAKKYDVDILVVDDGSTDDTSLKLSKVKDVHKIRHNINRGYGKALINAFQFAIDNCYDYIITMDTDGQHMPDEIPFFINEIPEWDIVSGSRYFDKMYQKDIVPPDRYNINQEITSTINSITNLNITDSFCGFKAYSVDSLRKFRLTETGYGMPLQLWIQAWHLELKIKEIKVKLIYNDFYKQFSNGLDNSEVRLQYYRSIIENEINNSRVGCAS